jgi:hypothetical protein
MPQLKCDEWPDDGELTTTEQETALWVEAAARTAVRAKDVSADRGRNAWRQHGCELALMTVPARQYPRDCRVRLDSVSDC